MVREGKGREWIGGMVWCGGAGCGVRCSGVASRLLVVSGLGGVKTNKLALLVVLAIESAELILTTALTVVLKWAGPWGV